MPPRKQPITKKHLVGASIFLVPAVLVAFIIYSIVGRKTDPAASQPASAFNMSMPSPNLDKTEKNKLELYMADHQDSAAQLRLSAMSSLNSFGSSTSDSLRLSDSVDKYGTIRRAKLTDPNEQKVDDRMAQIYEKLAKTTSPTSLSRKVNDNDAHGQNPDTDPQIERLERLIGAIQTRDTTTNPQLEQASQVMDKLLAYKSLPAGQKAPAPSITVVSAQPDTAPPDFPKEITGFDNSFWGFSNDSESGTAVAVPMLAVISANQTIVNEDRVQLRLLQDIFVQGTKVPANTFIYGLASISGNRVLIQLTNIVVGAKSVPVTMRVCDAMDGLDGLSVPGVMTSDVVKQNASQSLSGVNLGPLDPSIGAQAAAAGIETARTLFSKKVKLVKATLKEGHLVILRPATN